MRINVGLVGLTHPHTHGHLRELELMDDVAAIYVAEEDAALLAEVQGRPKVAGGFSTLDDLLRRDDVPVLVLMKRNYEAAPAALRALAAGKHVIGDKPLVRTADEMAGLVDVAARHNVLLGVFYCYRWSPRNRQILRLREAGALGRILSAEMRMVTTSVAVGDPRGWVFKRELAGGGILHWLGCHEIEWLRYVTGEEVTAVVAMVRTVSGEAIDVEDLAAVSFSLSGGGLATLHNGYLLIRNRLGYDYDRYDPYHALRGTHGRLWTEVGRQDETVILESAAPGWDHAQRHTFAYTLPASDAYAGVFGMDFLRAFFRAALEGGPPPAAGEDNLKVLQIVEAAYRSSETGRAIAL
jgi:predicted dehydrogenase